MQPTPLLAGWALKNAETADDRQYHPLRYSTVQSSTEGGYSVQPAVQPQAARVLRPVAGEVFRPTVAFLVCWWGYSRQTQVSVSAHADAGYVVVHIMGLSPI